MIAARRKGSLCSAAGGGAANYRLIYRPCTLTVLAPPGRAPYRIFFPLMQQGGA